MQPLKTYTLHISVFAILLQNTEPRFPHKKHLENHPGFDLKAEKDDEAFRDQRKVYVCLHLLCIISTFCLILPFWFFSGGGRGDGCTGSSLLLGLSFSCGSGDYSLAAELGLHFAVAYLVEH